LGQLHDGVIKHQDPYTISDILYKRVYCNAFIYYLFSYMHLNTHM
jgi:hypothetical protein